MKTPKNKPVETICPLGKAKSDFISPASFVKNSPLGKTDIFICEDCGEVLKSLTEVNIHSLQEKHYTYKNNLFDKMRLMVC